MTKYIDRYYLNGELYGIKFAGGGGGGRQPGANTVLYFPLENDAVDTVNNITLTSSGTTNYTTVGGVTSAEFTKSNYLYNSSVNVIPQGDVAKTLSTWIYIKGHNTSWGGIAMVGENSAGKIFGLGQYQNNSDIIMTRGWSTSNRYTPTLNTWINAVISYANSTWTLYINGQQEVTRNETAPTTGTWVNIGQTTAELGYGSMFYGNISNVILEDKARTAQEISDYYNQTKSLYGIS